jgi:hypothetical protein
MNIEHCSQYFKNYSQKISLFTYIQFFGLMALTLLEPSTSLTPHYVVPPSFCHRILTRCFATAPHALSLVSTRIPHYPLTLSLWDGSLTICWTLAVSPWEDSLTIRWTLAVSPWGDSIAIRCLLAVSPWGHWPCTFECWPYIALISFLDTSTLFQTTLSVSFSRRHEKDLVVSPFNSKALV